MSRYYDDGYGYPEYVPVGDRKANAAKKIARLRKQGHKLDPIEIEGRTIATTFWGKAWCKNLEGYSDYANRLPRGRTYVRYGSVIDLQATPGQVGPKKKPGIIKAQVDGSSLYSINVKITPIDPAQWKAIKAACTGEVNSLIELLQGKLSKAVMEVVTRPGSGLFPTPKQIKFTCSCPDWADMCKHVAATLYGIGARLDHNPALLFALRGVDPEQLIEDSLAGQLTGLASSQRNTLPSKALAAIFGHTIDLDPDALQVAPPKRATRKRKTTKTTRKKTSAKKSKVAPKKANSKKPKVVPEKATPKNTTRKKATRKKA